MIDPDNFHSPPAARPLVLIADDYEDSRLLYKDYLEFFGLDVVTVASGDEAVRLAFARRPALILMDIRMAVLTGTEALRAIRRDATLAHVPIVAFTAHALDGERRAILADGFDGCISKPCLPQDLLVFIRNTLATVSKEVGNTT